MIQSVLLILIVYFAWKQENPIKETLFLFFIVHASFEMLSKELKIYNGYIYFISAALISFIVINHISKLKEITPNLINLLNINIAFIHASWIGFVISEMDISAIYFNIACYCLYASVLLLAVSKRKGDGLVRDFKISWLGGFVRIYNSPRVLQAQTS